MKDFKILTARKSCDNCAHNAMSTCESSTEFWNKRATAGEMNMVCDGWESDIPDSDESEG